MKLTFYAHSCFAVEVKGKRILFDPFITGNPAAQGIDVNSIEADFLFLSHGHGDHVADAVGIAKRTGALCVGSPEVMGWLERQGVTNTIHMNHGGPVSHDFGFGKVRGVNAVHSSSLPDGSYGGNPLGFVFNTEEGDFYFAGDTALTLDMQLIPLWARLQFAVLPIGGHFTMDAADALKASEFIKCDTIVGVHHGTFGIIKIDTQKAVNDFKAAGKKLLLPAALETISF